MKYLIALIACCCATSNPSAARAEQADLSGIDISVEQGITKFRKGDEITKIGVRIVNNLDYALGFATFQCVAMNQDNAIGTTDGLVMNVKAHGTVFETARMETPSEKPSRIDCRITGATSQ